MLYQRSSVFFALVMGVVASMTLLGCPEVGVLEDGLVIVDDVPGLEVVALEEGAISFAGRAASPLQAGDIIVGTAEGGFLRRVEAVSESRGGLLVKTLPASMNEAIRSGLLLQGFEFTTQDFINAGLLDANGGATLIDLSGTDIYRDNGVAITVTTGTLECVPDIHLAARWEKWNLEGFRLHTSGTAKLDFDVSVAVDNQTPLTFETDLIPPVVHPFATAIGPIPVVGRAALRFPIGVTAKFDGDTRATAGFDVVDTFEIGASMEYGHWDRSFQLGNPVFTGHEPVWVVEIGANVKVYVKVVTEVSLYESADLAGYLMPYLNANVAVYPSPMTFVLTGGLDAGFSYGLGIFDYQLLGDSYHWYGPSAVLYTYSAAY